MVMILFSVRKQDVGLSLLVEIYVGIELFD